MNNRIENLWDYNTARIMLQKKNGDLSALIKEFKDTGAHEALPKQLCVGMFIGASILLSGQYMARQINNYVKKRRQDKSEREKALKKELENALTTDSDFSETEELPCS